MNRHYELADLLRIMAALRDPEGGCPWDLEQDFDSLIPHTLSEVYELVEALECGDDAQIRDELGDVLLQLVFYCQLGSEAGRFDFAAVIQHLSEKLVRRHPHVFANRDGKNTLHSAAEVNERWQQIKAAERGESGSRQPPLMRTGIDRPALQRAETLQKIAAEVGFDWRDAAGALRQLYAEAAELEDELKLQDSAARRQRCGEELGDLLFCCVNIARHLGVDSEAALRAANRRFAHRFTAMEGLAEGAGTSLERADAAQLELFWQQAKHSQTDAETDH